MKRLLFLLSIVFAFSACNKCQDCTCNSVATEVCQDDFDSNDDYNEAISALELSGCSCN
jgi:hypothetical protein